MVFAVARCPSLDRKITLVDESSIGAPVAFPVASTGCQLSGCARDAVFIKFRAPSVASSARRHQSDACNARRSWRPRGSSSGGGRQHELRTQSAVEARRGESSTQTVCAPASTSAILGHVRVGLCDSLTASLDRVTGGPSSVW